MHRETPLDFWLTVATIASLFVPVWGVLLAPTKLINIPLYLVIVGGAAFVVVAGTLVYAKYKNRILLNRFLLGYLGGLAGTAVIHIFMAAGIALHLMPNLVYVLGNLALGRGMVATPSSAALLLGIAYHYLLNGAAWGAVYALLVGKGKWWFGAFYGAAIWAALMVSPVFYALNLPKLALGRGPLLIVMMLIAHLVYGGIIGYIVYRYVYPEVGIEGSKAIRPTYS